MCKQHFKEVYRKNFNICNFSCLATKINENSTLTNIGRFVAMTTVDSENIQDMHSDIKKQSLNTMKYS